MSLPLEIQRYLFEFIQPYMTRDDWRTCRHHESGIMRTLIERYQKGVPRNDSHPVHYKDWSFYERLRFGVVDSKREAYLKFWFKMRRIPYFF